MAEAIVVVVVILAILSVALWLWYQSRGKIIGRASLASGELVDEVERYFVPNGWKVQHRGADFLIMQRGASPLTGCILLVLFFPLGLVYLLTEWGRGRMALAFRDSGAGRTEFQFAWGNALVRGEIRRFLDSLDDR